MTGDTVFLHEIYTNGCLLLFLLRKLHSLLRNDDHFSFKPLAKLRNDG
jgi:hypothetical protein